MIKFIASDITIDKGKGWTDSIKFIASDIYVVSDTSAIIEDTFEFEIGDELYPVDTVHLTQPYGENVSDGDGGSALMFEDIELVRDNTSNIVQDLLDLYEGFSYGQYDLRTIGDPFIGVGNYIKVLDYDYGEHDVLVTERKFTDNGVWRTEIKADIPEQEEINTNYVGTFEQRTEIIVDKVNKEIEAVVAEQDDVREVTNQLVIDVDGLSSDVKEVHNGNIIPNLNGEVGYTGWVGEDDLILTDDLQMYQGLNVNHSFIPKILPNSASRWGISMYGNNTTNRGYIIPDSKYSFMGRVITWKNFDITVLEYDVGDKYTEVSSELDLNLSQINEYEVESSLMSISGKELEINVSNLSDRVIIVKFYNKGVVKKTHKLTSPVNESFNVLNYDGVILRVQPNDGASIIRETSVEDVLENSTLMLTHDVEVEPYVETNYSFNKYSPYVTFTHIPQPDTKYISLKFMPKNASIDSRLELTEMMFNRGEPKSWFESTESTKYYANSLFEQLSNKIVLMVDNDGKIVQAELGVDPETGSYFVIGADNISLNGYTEINGKFRVNEDGTVFMQDAYVEGTIVAEKGMVGQLELEDGYLVKTYIETMKKYTQSDADYIRDIIMGNIIPSEYDYETYDLNKDGVINISDFAIVRKLLLDGPNPAEREYRLELGGNTGTIRTSSRIVGLYDEPFGIEMRGSQLVASGVNTRNITSPNNQNTRIDLMDDSMSLGVNNLESYIGIYSDYYVDDVKSSVIRLLSDGYIWANATNNIELSSQNGDIKLASYSTPYPSVEVNSYSLRPEYNDSTYLGTSGRRWKTVYLQSQPNVSSDIRYKYSVQDIPDDLVEQLSKVEPKMYLQGNKWHFGYIAQDIERALYKWATNKYGLDARHYVDKFAFLHKDESYLSLLYGEISVIKEKEMRDRIDRLEKLVEELITNV